MLRVLVEKWTSYKAESSTQTGSLGRQKEMLEPKSRVGEMETL